MPEKYVFPLIEALTGAFLLYTYFALEPNGMLLICGIVLLGDVFIRLVRSHHEKT